MDAVVVKAENPTRKNSGKDRVRVQRKTLEAVLEQCQMALQQLTSDCDDDLAGTEVSGDSSSATCCDTEAAEVSLCFIYFLSSFLGTNELVWISVICCSRIPWVFNWIGLESNFSLLLFSYLLVWKSMRWFFWSRWPGKLVCPNFKNGLIVL